MSAYPGNFGTSPNQSVFTSDIGSATRLATSAEFSRYLTDEIYFRSAFVQSGVMALDARLNGVGGVKAEIPFFKPLNFNEESVNSSATWGTAGVGAYQTQKTSAGTQYGVWTTRGAAFAADDLSNVQVGEDSLGNIRSQLAADIATKQTTKLLSCLTGMFGTALAGNSLDLSEATAGSENDSNYLNVTNVTRAKFLLGERASSINTIAMHSLVAARLQEIGMLTFSAPAGVTTGSAIQFGGGGVGVSSTEVGYFAGLRVLIDDQLPILGTTGENQQFQCFMFGSGIVKTGSQFGMSIETERNILSRQNIMTVTYNSCMHVPGVSWTSGNTDPENSDLANAGNWSYVYDDLRTTPLVSLVVNSPYGGLVP
nr:phage capsid protein [uncultured Mediterranean phage uvMED]